MKRKLVLENGLEFIGSSFGKVGDVIAEIVFNTSVVSYHEVLSDPLYSNQMVLMTYPIIGTYGLADEDYDPKNTFVKAYIIKEYNDIPSNFRSTRTLVDAMEENNIIGLCGVDTRAIAKIIRDEGTMFGYICDVDKSVDGALKEIQNYKENKPSEKVTCKKVWYARTANPIYQVVAIDLGCKTSVIKSLNSVGINVTVVPSSSTYEDIMKFKPNGILFTNGPSSPIDNLEIVELAKKFIGNIPVMGLSLGMEIIALAYGANTYKMKFGHHGSNITIRNVNNNKLQIVSENRLYGIEKESIKNTDLKITYENILDGSVEGIKDVKNKVIGFGFEPQTVIDNEEYIFTQFINLMK